jgi:PAS domain S-box-containing protein
VSGMRTALGGAIACYEGAYDLTDAAVGTPLQLVLHFHPLRDPTSGAVVGAVGFVDDIADRVLTVQALESSEARFRTIIERSRDAIAVYRAGLFVFVNPSMAEILRYEKPSDLVGMSMLDVIHPDDRALVAARRQSYEQGKPLPPTELRFLRRDGTAGVIEFVSMPIDYDGPAILSIVRDMSEVRLMQANLLQSDRMASLGTLAAGVAHEINNPLAYMNTNLEGIENRKLPELRARITALEESVDEGPAALEASAAALRQLADEVGTMIRLAREGAEQVRTIVADLRTFSRSDHAPASWIDVQRVLDAAVHMAWSGLSRNIALTRSYGDMPSIFGNESRLAQVFLNILVNATHALEGRADARVDLTTSTDADGRAVITVRDNGHGMAADVVGRIFDPFFTTKRAGVGTGLGLWVCQVIVSSWGGRLDVTSEPDSGSCFTIVLPAGAPR